MTPHGTGTFYGIGVGPGDPELITLKAVRLLREVGVVFTSAQERSGRSLALEIAGPHLPAGAEVIPLTFSHTFRGVAERTLHRENARVVLDVLRRPSSAAFLTLGDPMTYSTFTYLAAALRELEPGVAVRVVPGITSYAATAAEALVPLVEGDESLTVVSAAQGIGQIEAALEHSENVVVLKPYRRITDVCDFLEERGLEAGAVFSVECTRPGGEVVRDLGEARKRAGRYMSLFLVKRGRSV